VGGGGGARGGGGGGGVAERQIERVGACGWVGMCVCAEVRVAVCVVARHTCISSRRCKRADIIIGWRINDI